MALTVALFVNVPTTTNSPKTPKFDNSSEQSSLKYLYNIYIFKYRNTEIKLYQTTILCISSYQWKQRRGINRGITNARIQLIKLKPTKPSSDTLHYIKVDEYPEMGHTAFRNKGFREMRKKQTNRPTQTDKCAKERQDVMEEQRLSHTLV